MIKRASSNDIVEKFLDELGHKIEAHFEADLLAFAGWLVSPVEDYLRETIETRDARRKKLTMIVETDGGYIEVVQRIVTVLRTHYEHVEFIIPDHAMSAGTVLVMSGDAIHMDYYSVLGPIDPQITNASEDRLIPALGYLEQYNRLVEKSAQGKLTTAELAFLVQNFNPAELYQYEQARKLSVSLLKEWLAKYKFKDWSETETRKQKVTTDMRAARAEEVGNMLNNIERWHSHGHGISMDVLRNELKLQIEDFGSDPSRSACIREYHRLLVDYLGRRGHKIVVHRPGDYRALVVK